jgi:hypothetical protein
MENLEKELDALAKQVKRVELEGRAAKLLKNRTEFTVYLDDKPHKVKIKSRITGRLMDDGLGMIGEHNEKSEKLKAILEGVDQFQNLAKGFDKKDDDGKAEDLKAVANLDLSNFMSKIIDAKKTTMRFNIDFAKMFLDIKSAKNEIVELWDDEDFWMDQDYLELAEICEFFRKKLGINVL